MTDDRNPYLPPTAETAPEPPAAVDAPLASKGRRFGTLVVDYVGFYLCGALAGFTMAILFGQAGIRALQSIPQLLMGLVIVFLYYLVFEGAWGRTPGKMVFGTTVVDASGRKPPLGTIAKRTLCRMIPFEAFTFFGESGLHDRLSATRVVMTRRS